jgi:hypothetical protein
MYSLQYKLFTLFLVLFYAFAILSALGLYSNAHAYVEQMDYYMRIYICLFLIWRFNPLSKHQFDALDKKIVFISGMIILSTTALNQYLLNFKIRLVNAILPIVQKNENQYTLEDLKWDDLSPSK